MCTVTLIDSNLNKDSRRIQCKKSVKDNRMNRVHGTPVPFSFFELFIFIRQPSGRLKKHRKT